MRRVFLDYDQAALDQAFDQRVWAANGDAVLAHLHATGQAVRQAAALHADLRYGARADERLDWFPATQAGGAIHLHIHGGAWRYLRKEDAAFAAPAFVAAGTHYVVPDFSALPGVRLVDVVEQLTRALCWVYHHADQYGADRDRIYLSGHSSGAHLCAVLLTTDWTMHGLPADVIKGGLCISGIYDLAPVMLSARRSYVKLSADETIRLSPVENVEALSCPVSIVYAQHDSPEFRRQARHFHDKAMALSKPVALASLPDMNHFEIISELPRLAASCQGLKPPMIQRPA